MKPTALGLALVLILCSAPVADARPIDEQWAAAVADAAELQPQGPVVAKTLKRRGNHAGYYAQIDLGSITAARYMFERQRDAIDFAIKRMGEAEGRILIEKHGSQLVVLEGAGLSDAAKTKAVREAAWKTLPRPGGEPDALVVGDDGTFVGRGPAAETFVTVSSANTQALDAYLTAVAGEEEARETVEMTLPPPAALELLEERPARTGQAPRVVVVKVDKKTQDALGPFGGSYRQHHDDLVRRLNELGARGIAFDMYFPQNDDEVENTRLFAEAAANSKAPVVVSVYTEQQADGSIAKLPNMAVIADNDKIGEGSVLAVPELILDGGLEQANREYGRANSEGRDPEFAMRHGPYSILASSAGYRTLIDELAVRTGDLFSGEIDSHGLPTGLALDNDMNLVYAKTQAIRPAIQDPSHMTSVSYVDVLLEQGDLSAIDGALVIIGIDDGVQDRMPNPDPVGAPDIESISGVYVHAFALRRVLAVAYPDTRAEEPKARTGLIGAEAYDAKDDSGR